MSKDNKTDQLRVRLTKPERESLEAAIINRGQNETISDVIRGALAWLIDPSGKNGTPVYIDAETQKNIKYLQTLLDRDPASILKDCVNGILYAVDGKTPLIVREIKLRATYLKSK